MTNEDLSILKANLDKKVKITFSNREVSLVMVILVSEDEGDLIYDLVCTNKESMYKKLDQQPAYLATFDEIIKVEAIVGQESLEA